MTAKDTVVELTVDPSETVGSLSPTEFHQRYLMLNLEAFQREAGALVVIVDVVFNPIRVRQAGILQTELYIGSTGAEIWFMPDGGRITRKTIPTKLEVAHRLDRSQSGSATADLAPEFEFGKLVVLKLGKVTAKVDGGEKASASFKITEDVLAVTLMGSRAVEWTMSLPRGEKVMRDYFEGNLILFAECQWSDSPPAGTVEVIPSGVRVFDADHRPLSVWRSAAIRYILQLKGKRVEPSGPLEFAFKTKESDDGR